MNTKEAVEWIFDIWHEWENVYGVDGEQVLEEGKKMDEVIELLQRGEKYEAIEKGIKQYCLILERQNVLKEVIRLEHKYFPPQPSKDFTEKVMEKIRKEVAND